MATHENSPFAVLTGTRVDPAAEITPEMLDAAEKAAREIAGYQWEMMLRDKPPITLRETLAKFYREMQGAKRGT